MACAKDQHRHPFIDQGDRPVLHLPRRVSLGVDVGDHLELERPLQSDRIGDPAGDEEHLPYAIVIAYSDDDKGYIATIPELPGCSAFGDTEEEAIKEVKVAASLWLAAAKKARRPIPEPIVEKTFKARFPLRIPEDLRRRLELEAKRKGVSLNHLILQRIA